MFTELQLAQYREDGYFLAKSLFDAEETDLLQRAARTDPAIAKKAMHRADGEGGQSKMTLWNDVGDDLMGTIARSERIVSGMEQILGGEVYHWHSKMMQKEPFVGGAWIWHQDYGYWYGDNCLFPLLASCYIAVDPATKDNGCLQVLKGSHLIGRIDHIKVGDQTGADPERCVEAEKVCPLVYCEMRPGDALFFDGNLLHRSDQNKSPNPRWGFICCYNARRNSPFKPAHHPSYTPLARVPDSAVKEVGLRFLSADADYLVES